MVGATIVRYARELGIGEHKIASFLARTPAEQLALFRTLHQVGPSRPRIAAWPRIACARGDAPLQTIFWVNMRCPCLVAAAVRLQ